MIVFAAKREDSIHASRFWCIFVVYSVRVCDFAEISYLCVCVCVCVCVPCMLKYLT